MKQVTLRLVGLSVLLLAACGQIQFFHLGRPRPIPPAAPASPTPADQATAVPITQVLSWATSNRATGYDVYFGSSNPPPRDLSIQKQPGTTYTPPFLTSGQLYFWQIIAYSSGGATVGPVWSFTVGVGTPPAVPNTPSPVNGATGVAANPTLTWASSGATSFDLAFGTSVCNPNAFNTLCDVIDSQFVGASHATTTQPATTYHWRVRAHNGGGTVVGPDWTFTTAGSLLPGTPMMPVPANGATGVSTSPTLTFASTLATSYSILGPDIGTPTTLHNLGSTPSYQATGLQNNQTYSWQATGTNGSGSTQGPVWSFTTVAVPLPTVPANPSPVSGATGVGTSPLLSFTSSNATSYSILGPDPTSPPVTSHALGSNPTYQATGLAASQTYFWQATGTNASGSTQGPIWNFQTAAAGTQRVITASDITYLCTFALPEGASSEGGSPFAAGPFGFSGGLTVRRISGTAYVLTLADAPAAQGEPYLFLPPATCNAGAAPGTTDGTSLINATFQERWGNIYQNARPPHPQNGLKLGGILWTNEGATGSRLYWQYWGNYVQQAGQMRTFGYSTLTDCTPLPCESGSGTAFGSWTLSDNNFYTENLGIFQVPPSARVGGGPTIQSVTGTKTIGIGNGGTAVMSGVTQESPGPALAVSDPTTWPASNTVGGTLYQCNSDCTLGQDGNCLTACTVPASGWARLLNYRPFNDCVTNCPGGLLCDRATRPLTGLPWTGPQSMYDNPACPWPVTKYGGDDGGAITGVWIDTASLRGLLYYGTFPSGTEGYRTVPGTGVYDENLEYYFTAYDPDDLIPIAQGSLNPWRVQPRNQWRVIPANGANPIYNAVRGTAATLSSPTLTLTVPGHNVPLVTPGETRIVIRGATDPNWNRDWYVSCASATTLTLCDASQTSCAACAGTPNCGDPPHACQDSAFPASAPAGTWTITRMLHDETGFFFPFGMAYDTVSRRLYVAYAGSNPAGTGSAVNIDTYCVGGAGC